MKLSRASAIVMTVAAISAVFGLLREAVIAAEFGTTFESDAYFFSFDLMARLPEFLVPAIGGALIPVYLRSKQEGGDDRFVHSVITAYSLGLAVLAVVVAILAPAVAAVMGSGFPEEQRPTVVSMIRLMSPAMTLLGVAGVLRALLNAENKFFAAQVSHVWLSLGIVVATITLAPRMGINAPAVGVVAGAAVQVVWTGFWLRRGGFRYRFLLDVSDPRFRRFLQLLGPGVVGALLSWFIPVADKWLASHLTEGAIATLSFASRPVALLSRIGINSIVVAALPVYTAKALQADQSEYRASVVRTLKVVVFALLPLSLILVALRSQVIEVLFERGEFDADAAVRTARVFAASVVQLAPAGVAVVVATAFNSLEDVRTPAIFGAGTNVVVKLIAGPLLMIPLDVAGLALSTTFMYMASGYVLVHLYRRRVQIDLGELVHSYARTLIAALGAWVAVELLVGQATLAAFPMAVAGAGLGTVVFLALAALVRSPELEFLYRRLKASRVRNRG